MEQKESLPVDEGPDKFHFSWRLCQPFDVELVLLALQLFTMNRLVLPFPFNESLLSETQSKLCWGFHTLLQ